ncbi:helix-turn-helix domain-containing protein [soil metagenome]
MIVFDFRPPSPNLQEFVRQYQIVGFEFKENETIPWKPYWPRAEYCLSFYPRETERVEYINGQTEEDKPRSTIIGQPCTLTRKHVKNDFLIFQIVFQPGALFRLTGIPAKELTDTFIDAEAVFSGEINLVNERLSSSGSHLEMINIVEEFLYFLIRRVKYEKKPIDKVSLYLLNNPKYPSFDWLASEACLSSKQFYLKFVERMGVSPKMFARLTQFHQAMIRKQLQPHKDWLSIALDLGYYDYQHLVRDFKEFTLLTPPAFFLEDNNAPERRFGYKEM